MAQDVLQLENARHNYPAPRLWHRSSLKNSTATPIDPSPLALLSPLPTLALPSRSRVTEKCSKMSNFPENPEEICKHHQPSIIIITSIKLNTPSISAANSARYFCKRALLAPPLFLLWREKRLETRHLRHRRCQLCARHCTLCHTDVCALVSLVSASSPWPATPSEPRLAALHCV